MNCKLHNCQVRMMIPISDLSMEFAKQYSHLNGGNRRSFSMLHSIQ